MCVKCKEYNSHIPNFRVISPYYFTDVRVGGDNAVIGDCCSSLTLFTLAVKITSKYVMELH